MREAIIRGVAVTACLIMGLLVLWERNSLVEMGLEIQDIQKTQKDLMQVQHELLIEISSLSSYQRIEQIATNELGMIRPDPHQVVKVLNSVPVEWDQELKSSIRVAER